MKKGTIAILSAIVAALLFTGCKEPTHYPVLDQPKLAAKFFGEDAQWYIDNIPFFECSDSTLEQVYYYRWKMYKAHIRNVGENAYVITEFINHVPWDRDPFCTINAASMHHIYEGRWLKDDRFMNGYIHNLLQEGAITGATVKAWPMLYMPVILSIPIPLFYWRNWTA
ncbi:MAG: hypothetical protein JNK14_16570 [Chitinophagaceae bacterium]|nr:hypothetical protein [Chitinophagaceae bacterium]